MRSTDQSYSRDNSVISAYSPYRSRCLRPQCRLWISSSCRRFEGCGCSPPKIQREVGLIRRKTGLILSGDFDNKTKQLKERRP